MIKHIVMWNVRGDTPHEKARGVATIERSFADLRGKIPGLLLLEIGVDASRIDYACDVVLYSEFEAQAAARRALQTLLHPELLGTTFQFLALTKNVSLETPLSGFKFSRAPRAALQL